MFLMLFYRVTEHKYIIEIYVYKSSDEVSEDHSHQLLECSGGVTVPLLHSMAHKCAVYCGKHGFPYILGFNMYLLVHVRHIDLRSVFSPSNIHTDLLLIRERCYIFLCVFILFPPIYDGTKSS